MISIGEVHHDISYTSNYCEMLTCKLQKLTYLVSFVDQVFTDCPTQPQKLVWERNCKTPVVTVTVAYVPSSSEYKTSS